MSTKCSEIIRFMEEMAPACLAEEWDNVGLIIGSRNQDIKRVMVCLDVTSKVVNEAVEKKVDMIVSHHPFIFKGLKRITEDDPKGSVVYRLIRNGIGVYSAHTNLDFTVEGINDTLASLLGLSNVRSLKKYRSGKLYKVVVFVPEAQVDQVREAMSNAGAGWIGNYSHCSFMAKGKGTFKPLEGTNPYIGSQGNLEKVEEYRLETVVPQEKLKNVINSMIEAHPYEEVAYDVYSLEIDGKEYGYGKVGTLAEAQKPESFISSVKEKLNVNNVRVIGNPKKEISNVAVFCGSFDERLLSGLKGVDVLVTGDLKYHTCLDAAEMGLFIVDAGHYGTERVIVPKLAQTLAKKFPSIEVVTSELEEDPIKTY